MQKTLNFWDKNFQELYEDLKIDIPCLSRTLHDGVVNHPGKALGVSGGCGYIR